MAVSANVIIALVTLALIIVLAVMSTGLKVIGQEERGIYLRLGRYVRILNPGMNMVAPLVSTVVKIDMRVQEIEIPRQEVITKDRVAVSVNGIMSVRVIDPSLAFFRVTNYRTSIMYLAQTTVSRLVGNMTYDEVLGNRTAIDEQLKKVVLDAAANWGVRVETAMVRELGPALNGSISTEGYGIKIPKGRIEHGAFKIGR